MGIDISCLGPAAQKQVLQKIQQQARSAKYRNVKTQREGAKKPITFDSQKEARRFDELMAMQRAGQIRNLKLQHEFTLQAGYTTPEGERIRAIRYLADFTYERLVGERWELVVEDVKSRATKTAAYLIKRKLMQERLGIDVKEVCYL